MCVCVCGGGCFAQQYVELAEFQMSLIHQSVSINVDFALWKKKVRNTCLQLYFILNNSHNTLICNITSAVFLAMLTQLIGSGTTTC